jgi:hypothetical protein
VGVNLLKEEVIKKKGDLSQKISHMKFIENNDLTKIIKKYFWYWKI